MARFERLTAMLNEMRAIRKSTPKVVYSEVYRGVRVNYQSMMSGQIVWEMPNESPLPSRIFPTLDQAKLGARATIERGATREPNIRRDKLST
jgi:hypothetical protein